MWLFSETTTSRFLAHPRFSGDTASEVCVRLYINGDSKVDLEIETIAFVEESTGSDPRYQVHTFATLEEALEFLGTESSVSNEVYNLVMHDMQKKRG
jgi:hypothetical protein